MELVQASTHLLDSSPLKGISRGLLYYVHTGRNAWHSNWVTQYANGCMHTTLESAKEYAEKRRTRGTVFYIKQLPCLVFRSKDTCVLVTEIMRDIEKKQGLIFFVLLNDGKALRVNERWGNRFAKFVFEKREAFLLQNIGIVFCLLEA